MPSVSNFQTALEGVLINQITAAATTATVKVKEINGVTPTWLTTAHRITIIQKSRTVTKVEVVDVAAGTTQSGTTVTLGTMTRGLPLDGTGFTGTGTPQVFTSGAKVIVTWDAQAGRQTAFKDVANTFSAAQTITAPLTVSGTTSYVKLPSLTTAQRTALSASNGMMVYDSDLGQVYQYIGGAWAAVGDTGTADASTTVAGKAEEATVAEVGAGTATGGTGARLFVNPSAVVKTSSGAGDENKLPALNASGQIADGFLPTVPVAKGGTGLTSVGTSGNVLKSNGTSWESGTISADQTKTSSIDQSANMDGASWTTGESYTITADTLAAGDVVEVIAITTSDGGTRDIRITVGGTATSTFTTAGGSGQGAAGRLHFVMTVRTSTTAWWAGLFTAGTTIANSNATSELAIDTTNSIAIAIQGQQTSGAETSHYVQQFIVTIRKAQATQ